MKEVKKYILKFRREFKIYKTPDIEKLKDIIEGLSYKLISYNDNKNLFYSLVNDSSKICKTAMVVTNRRQRYIFYNSDVSKGDLPFILAHEIAHIYLNHSRRHNGYFDTPEHKEQEANEFATFLMNSNLDSLIPLTIGLVGICSITTNYLLHQYKK